MDGVLEDEVRLAPMVLLATMLIVIAVALLSTESAHACFVQVNAPTGPNIIRLKPLPELNMYSGPDRVWRFADGTTVGEDHKPLWSEVLIAASYLTLTGLAIIAARQMIRLRHSRLTAD